MKNFSKLEYQDITTLFALALKEDHAWQDATSQAIFNATAQTTTTLIAREDMVFSGAAVLPILLSIKSPTAIVRHPTIPTPLSLSPSFPTPLAGGARGGLVPPSTPTKFSRHRDSTRKHDTQVKAQSLRENPTEAEKKLWHEALGRSQLEGYKFRRQQAIGIYIVDFVCMEKKLIIELDGGQHNEEEAGKQDAQRTRFLEQSGYRVMRFWNHEVMGNLEGVVEVILQGLQGEGTVHLRGDSPPLAPPASGVGKDGVAASGVGNESVTASGAENGGSSAYWDVSLNILVDDGQVLEAGQVIATLTGSTIHILSLERTLLNILQRLCGVATLTRRYVDAVAGTNTVILDTRKTIPGWRALDKYAVRCGGGQNHRMHLADAMMLKDNHIAASGGIDQAISKALKIKAKQGIAVIVECDTLAQLELVMAYPVDRVLLDNMNLDELKQAVKMVGGKFPLEASGGVNLSTVAAIASTGVDFISVGALTHSAVAVDIALDK